MATLAHSRQLQLWRTRLAPPANGSRGSFAWRQAVAALADKAVCEGYGVDVINAMAGRLRDADESFRCWAVDIIAEVSARLRGWNAQSQLQLLRQPSRLATDPSASARSHAGGGVASPSAATGVMAPPPKVVTSASIHGRASMNVNAQSTSPRTLRLVPHTASVLDGGCAHVAATPESSRWVTAPPPLTRSMLRLNPCQIHSRSSSVEVPAARARSMSVEVPSANPIFAPFRRVSAPSSLPSSPVKTPRAIIHTHTSCASVMKEAEALAKQAEKLLHQMEAIDPMHLVQQAVVTTITSSLHTVQASVQRMLSWISRSTSTATTSCESLFPVRRESEPILPGSTKRLSTIVATLNDGMGRCASSTSEASSLADPKLLLSKSIPSVSLIPPVNLDSLSVQNRIGSCPPAAEADLGNLAMNDKIPNCKQITGMDPDSFATKNQVRNDPTTDGVTVFDARFSLQKADCFDSCPPSSRGAQTATAPGSSRATQTFNSARHSSPATQASVCNEALEVVLDITAETTEQNSHENDQGALINMNFSGQDKNHHGSQTDISLDSLDDGDEVFSDMCWTKEDQLVQRADIHDYEGTEEEALSATKQAEETPITRSQAESTWTATRCNSRRGPPADVEKPVTVPLAPVPRKREACTSDYRGSSSFCVTDLSRIKPVASLRTSSMNSRNAPSPPSFRNSESARGTIVQNRSRDAQRWIPPGCAKRPQTAFL